MAQLANCPQCDHDLLVPDGAATGAWARCPSCRAFFQLKDAKSRDLPTLELVESAGGAEHGTQLAADDDELQLAGEFESAEMEPIAVDDADTSKADEFNFADLEAMLDDNEPSANAPSSMAPTTSAAGKDIMPEADEFKMAEIEDDEPLDLDSPQAEEPGSETLEEAAERIDAWFRSAKTVPDLPPVEDAAAEDSEMESTGHEHETEFVPSSAATNATIDLSSGGIDELDLKDDFELDQSSEEPQEVAAWDDSQRMEQLLAGVEDMPSDEFDEAAEAAEEAAAPTEQAAKVPAGKWSPEKTVSQLTRGGKPRRKRSFVRTFAMSVAGGLIGLALGYYALLWYQGPTGDFLNWANWLPKAMLPSSFNGSSRLMVAAPIVPQKSEATQPEPTSEPAPQADDAVKTADATTEPKTTPAEQQASFNAPATEEKPAADKDDRYAATTVNKPTEPATLDAPPAEPLQEPAPAPEPIQIPNAPSFTAKELDTAITASKDAGPNLKDGNLTDNAETARRKGASYTLLADLAQKVTFVDPTAQQVAQLRQAADVVFGETLIDAHTREEVAQIVPMWLASPKRRNGGVFFAGSVVGHEATGSYSVCSVDLGNGQSLPVVVPAALGERLKTVSGQVGIVGWIIDKPAESIKGVPATAPHAVYAGRIIALPQQ